MGGGLPYLVAPAVDGTSLERVSGPTRPGRGPGPENRFGREADPGLSRRAYDRSTTAGSKRMTIDLVLGVLLFSATESSGASTFVSG